MKFKDACTKTEGKYSVDGLGENRHEVCSYDNSQLVFYVTVVLSFNNLIANRAANTLHFKGKVDFGYDTGILGRSICMKTGDTITSFSKYNMPGATIMHKTNDDFCKF